MSESTEPEKQTTSPNARAARWWERRLLVAAVLFGIVVMAFLTWRYGPALWELAQDRAATEALVLQLGWFGPIALVGLNAAQIIVAPIPGYVMYAAAGFLFGPFWGGVWGSAGLLLGSMAAMWLARTFGQPLVERMFGQARVARWEQVTHSSSTVVWLVLLLGPTGDLPYYLAGLSHVGYIKILLITLTIRVPTVFFTATAGAGVLLLEWWQIGLIIALLAVVTLLFFRFQGRFMAWTERSLQRRLS